MLIRSFRTSFLPLSGVIALFCLFGTTAPYGHLEGQSLSASSPAREYVYSSGALVAVRQYGNEGPATTLSSNNAFGLAPATVVLTATATDADGVASVKFFRDGQLIATDNGSPFQYTWNSAPAGSYKWMAEATDNLGNTAISDPFYMSITPSTGTLWTESGGLVEIEAEDGETIDRNGKSWTLRTDVASYSGSGFLRAEPATGTYLPEVVDYWGEAPEVTYAVNFTTTGTYWVWIRGIMSTTQQAVGPVHVGLDNVASSTAGRGIKDFGNSGWTWSNETGTRATINVTTAGTHQLNVWMGTDGVQIDSIVLVNTDLYIPVFEAESAVSVNGSGADTWNFASDVAGFSGTGFMRALVDNGTNNSTTYVGVSPELKARVNMPTSFSGGSSFYVWVRAYSTGASDDTVHVGRDGSASSTSDKISSFTTNNWSWSSTTQDSSSRATVGVSLGNINTINLWMGEDGIRIDKIFLVRSSTYTP